MIAHRRSPLVVVAALAVAACGHRGSSTSPPLDRRPAAAPARVGVDLEMVRTLAVLATRRSPSPAELAATGRQLEAETLTISGYIDALVDSAEFAVDVAPLVILRQPLTQNAYAAPSLYVLKRTEDARPVYHLYKPCRWEDAQPVHPWWDLDAEVRVCPDSIMPDQWAAKRPKGEPEMKCLSELAPYQEDGGTRCGCGPNLVRCFQSTAHRNQVAESLRDELRRSIAHNVTGELPVEQIFTSNETFRDRNAEFVRRAQLIELRRDAKPEAFLRELAAWPEAGQWAAREDLVPGQHAGVLTASHLVFFLPDRRQRMSALYDVLWCAEPDSLGATPESVLKIAGGDLQIKSAGWRDLAARPLCTTCHARLDYGLQFFLGYPNANFQSYFDPALQASGPGPLYVRDIQDPRGTAEQNPRAFAELSVHQPEFRRCMARDFAEYALGNRLTREQVDRMVAAMTPDHTTVRELMRAALEMLAAGWSIQPPDPARPAPPARTTAERVPVAGELASQLEAHCLDCHDADPARVDLSLKALDRTTIAAMLEEVAFGRMPHERPLPVAERTAFVGAFIDAAWTTAEAATARSYYLGRMAALPAFRPEGVFDLIHRAAGGSPGTRWRLLEKVPHSDLQQVTPGLATISALAAIEACHERTGAARERCISEVLKLDNIASHK